jgi:hypothetical protein
MRGTGVGLLSRAGACNERAAMIKPLCLVWAREGPGAEELIEHWRGPHADIVRNLPGIRRLCFGVVQKRSPGGTPSLSVGETWSDRLAAAREAFATEPNPSRLVADHQLFLREAEWCVVEEHTVLPPPSFRSEEER